MFGGEREGQLFAPDDFNLILGADGMNEVSINLSNSSVKEGADPNGSSMEEFYGFYMIVGLVSEDGGSIYIDNEDITTLPIHGRARKGLGYLPTGAINI